MEWQTTVCTGGNVDLVGDFTFSDEETSQIHQSVPGISRNNKEY